MNVNALRKRGVNVIGEGVYVGDDCVIEAEATIYAPAYIADGSHVCRGARIMPFCHISAAHVGEDTTVFSSTLIGAHVGKNCNVGPYAYLRGGAVVGDNCRIGDFVEIKSSTLGNCTKAAHLAYIGDAEIGERVNIGCGAVFANYDGKNKHKTTVGDGCFIGCNCNIVAPLSIKSGAFIAAGTTLTKDLQKDDFCIGRTQERIISGGAKGRYSAR